MSKVSAESLTTLDLLKTWALALLLVDVVGFFFFPVREIGAAAVGDPNWWWRVMGRLSVPVWFFLIGYARSRDLSPPLWIGGFLLLTMNLVAGWYVFPLDVLFTILAVRLILDRVALFTFERPAHLGLVLVGCTMFLIPLGFLSEFGSLALLLALTGFAVRHTGETAYPLLTRPATLSVLYWASFVAMAAFSAYFFMFNRAQEAVAGIGAGIVLHFLMKLQVRSETELAGRLGARGTCLIQWTGRHTLTVYVASILFFQAFCWTFGLGLPLYHFMDWEWTAMESFYKMISTTGTFVPSDPIR